ncbi:ATP-binding cassette domain-containing protein [Canibacter zhoujuaniae]|uniref:ATP-binding cassette domain-containing protein n=1 Tax=Canibacter zhoujuaniae TaxID=2708343 RepID=UPI00141ECE7D|nr:ABC transporter ATP-binding protein [Canibacter zhoujuaniae]
MDDLLLSARELSKKYGKNSSYALEKFNGDFSAGELVAVIGSNGAGKSTLFDILGGLIKPTKGVLNTFVDNTQIGWCPQREVIDWSLTVRQNISLGFELRTGSFRRSDQIEQVASLLGLAGYLDQTAETLSGGELRRTQIARAIIGNPKLMILDEPTTGLDPSAIDTVFKYLKSQTMAGATALVSTHETSKFANYCTRVIAIDRGRVIKDIEAAKFMEYAPQSNDLWDAFKACVEDRA